MFLLCCDTPNLFFCISDDNNYHLDCIQLIVQEYGKVKASYQSYRVTKIHHLHV